MVPCYQDTFPWLNWKSQGLDDFHHQMKLVLFMWIFEDKKIDTKTTTLVEVYSGIF